MVPRLVRAVWACHFFFVFEEVVAASTKFVNGGKRVAAKVKALMKLVKGFRNSVPWWQVETKQREESSNLILEGEKLVR